MAEVVVVQLRPGIWSAHCTVHGYCALWGTSAGAAIDGMGHAAAHHQTR